MRRKPSKPDFLPFPEPAKLFIFAGDLPSPETKRFPVIEPDGPPALPPAVASFGRAASSPRGFQRVSKFEPTVSRVTSIANRPIFRWKRPTRPTEHKNAHPRTARASSHPPRSLETARSFVHSSGVHGVPRWRAARRTRPPASSADVARAHSSAIGARVMARVIDAGGSRPAFEPRSSSADAVDVMLDPKEEVRLGGTRAFPRGHSPRARARAHQIVTHSFWKPPKRRAPLTRSSPRFRRQTSSTRTSPWPTCTSPAWKIWWRRTTEA